MQTGRLVDRGCKGRDVRFTKLVSGRRAFWKARRALLRKARSRNCSLDVHSLLTSSSRYVRTGSGTAGFSPLVLALLWSGRKWQNRRSKIHQTVGPVREPNSRAEDVAPQVPDA